MRRSRPVLLALVLSVGAVLSGCTAATPGPVRTSTAATAVVRFVQHDASQPAVADASSAAARAVQASRAYFAAAPGVVVAADGDRAAQQRAAEVAERRHVPLLLVPAAPAAPAASTAPSASASVSSSASASAPASESPSSSSTPSASASASAAALAAVTQEARRLGATWVAGEDAPRLGSLKRYALASAPAVTAPRPAGTVAVVANEAADTAAIATARAAGASVVSTDGSRIPGATSQVVTALTKQPDAAAVLIGSAFTRLDDPAWGVAAARSGYQYSGGGQVPFDGDRLFVALYGVPGDPVLGVLGEQGPAATVRRVEALADRYRPLTKRHVAPLLEVIATVASGSPTDNGDYSSDLDVSRLEPYVEAAAKAGLPVVLDLQPGRATFLSQAKLYTSLLEKPNVGLALDPEWRLGPGQKPLVQIGRVGAAEVNETSAWLADLVREKGLPPKPFVLHEFRLTMLQDRSSIDVSRPELDVLIHVDGQGSQPDKQATWAAVRAGAPDVAWGWKNFIDEDKPMLTPRQTIDEVHPTPDLITYQ